MIYPAADGQMMLDVLGKAFKKYGSPRVDQALFERAELFVVSQRNAFRADTSERGRKLAGRYQQLADYFSSRRYLWS
jgi:hypothetical protein